MKHCCPNNILLSVRGIVKLYDQYMETIRIERQLSQIEITIISFLHNNPDNDTARDISYMRMLPKGNVSQGVESLIQKSLLRRTPDKQDRRKIHLSLTEHARPIIEEIEEAKTDFAKQIFKGLSREELSLYWKVNECIMKNIQEDLERKKSHE